jgi:hypothetical protein
MPDMKKRTDSIRIVAIIWIAALFLNTVFGTALLTSLFTDAEMVGAYALTGFVFAAIFSLPLAVVLLFCLDLLIRMEVSGKRLFFFFFLVGNLLAAGTFLIFSFTAMAELLPVWSLFAVAAASGSVAMLLEYRAIVQLRKSEDDRVYKTFLND